MGLKEQVLAAVEAEVKQVISAESDAVVAAVLAKIEQLIPGKLDDVVIEGAKAQIEAVIKDELLKLADKISA